MAVGKKLGNELWHDSESIATKTVANEKGSRKPCKDLFWQRELRLSILRFFEQCATENNH